MRNLFLTSPHMKGPDVTELQKALYKHAYLQGAVDGEFGPDTHRAVYRAKFHLGYARPDHLAGAKLIGFLNGTRKPTKAMLAWQRKRKPKPVTLGYKKLKEAVKHIGVKESPPESNKVLFSRWYGMIGSWCAMFCSFCGVKVGYKVYVKGRYWAYVPFMVNDAKHGLFHYTITYKPQTGDDVAFDWNPPGVADHVGIYAEEQHLKELAPVAFQAARNRFGALKGDEFWCVEGNTAVGNNSNGGEVMIRKRHKSQVQAYMHPGG